MKTRYYLWCTLSHIQSYIVLDDFFALLPQGITGLHLCRRIWNIFNKFANICGQWGIARLNMELDLQSLFGLHVHSCTRWLRPRNAAPPPPRIWAHIRGRQDRQHLFVTP
jgi:hypothetical protein